jgi:hypothetical protein
MDSTSSSPSFFRPLEGFLGSSCIADSSMTVAQRTGVVLRGLNRSRPTSLQTQLCGSSGRARTQEGLPAVDHISQIKVRRQRA